MHMKNPRQIRFYFENRDTIYYLEGAANIMVEETHEEKANNKLSDPSNAHTVKYNYYRMSKSDKYSPDLKGLMKYKSDFDEWNNQLKNYNYGNNVFKIDYTKYLDDKSGALVLLNRLTHKYDKLKFQDANYKEFRKIEKCFNGGLTYFNYDKYKNVAVNCYGYDFSSFYGVTMGNTDFKFPMMIGEYKKIKKLNFKKLKYGIYECVITINNKNFENIFKFSGNNHYTHYELQLLNEHREQLEINIELLDDECLIYDDECEFINSDFFHTNNFCGLNWYDLLQNGLKKDLKGNQLVKNLISKIWGSFTQNNRRFFTEDEFFEQDVSDISDDYESEYKLFNLMTKRDGSKKYECILSKKPYVQKYARIKPFLTAYARTIMYRLIIENDLFDNIVRINTDGICLDKECDFTYLEYHPKLEDKTTGNIVWENLNKWKKV